MEVLGGLFGGKKEAEPKATPAPSAALSEAAPGAVAPGTTPDDFRRQEQAFYQQMLAGTGQGAAGGKLPEGIQANIDKQASLIK